MSHSAAENANPLQSYMVSVGQRQPVIVGSTSEIDNQKAKAVPPPGKLLGLGSSSTLDLNARF